MPPILTGLINDLDTSVLLLSGFHDGQNLQAAFIPDQVDVGQWRGWKGDAFGITLVANASPQGNYSVIRFANGNLDQLNTNVCLSSTNFTVMIAAKRTGMPTRCPYMGLYSMVYNFAKCGVTLLAFTDNNYDHNFNGWGTYNGTEPCKALSAMDLNVPVVVTMALDNTTNGTFYTNASATGTFTSSKSQGYLGIGGLECAQGFFIGDLYEVLVYNRTLSDSEVAQNANYLTSKWF